MGTKPEQPVTRFAPSPTGYLHLGHVAHMIYVWGIAARVGARVLLRIEDHDRGRCRPEYEQAILEDLAWLEFRADNELAGDYRQSDSDVVYLDAFEHLRREHEVYRCTCSRKRIAEHSPLGVEGERRYSGYCRSKQRSADEEHGLRVALEPGVEPFCDFLLGDQEQSPAEQCGDLLLRDRQGNWTYQLVVAADDLRHGVNLVIRGEDLLPSTGRQIRLARMLGRESPARFCHHPLIRDPQGEKLSKKSASGPVRELRRAGVSAEETIGRAAFGVGLTGSEGALSVEEAIALCADLDYSASNR